MHPKLIQASLALFHELYGETRRLLTEYQQEQPSLPEEERSLVLWLEAQSHTNREARLQGLRRLVDSTAEQDIYSKMARAYLSEEARYSEKPASRARFLLPGLILAGIVLLVIAVLVSRPSPIPSASTEDSPAANIENQLPLPDLSMMLNIESYTYPRGIIQFTAFEDNSQRVVRIEDGRLVEPVPGARFYALKVIFECRSGICNQPPEANIALRMDDSLVISAQPNLALGGERTLQAIAQGRTTTGWLVYEIPVVSLVAGVEIQYEEAPPHFIALPALLER